MARGHLNWIPFQAPVLAASRSPVPLAAGAPTASLLDSHRCPPASVLAHTLKVRHTHRRKREARQNLSHL